MYGPNNMKETDLSRQVAKILEESAKKKEQEEQNQKGPATRLPFMNS